MKRAPVERTNAELPEGDRPPHGSPELATSLGVRRCVACGRIHGPVGEGIACLEREVLRLRRELST